MRPCGMPETACGVSTITVVARAHTRVPRLVRCSRAPAIWTGPPRRRCIRPPARPCWPPTTPAGPTRPGCTGKAARPVCSTTRRAKQSPGALGVSAPEVSFTSSGTAAAHLAIFGALAVHRRPAAGADRLRDRALLRAARRRSARGCRRPADAASRRLHRPGRARTLCSPAPTTALVSVQSANQEIATRQPIAEIAERCARCRGAAARRRRPERRPRAGRRPGVGLRRCSAPAPTSSAARPAWACWWCATGRAGSGRGRRTTAAIRASAARCDVPGAVATAAALVARAGELADEAARLRRFSEQIRGARGRHPGRAGARRSGSRRTPPPPGQHVVPLRRRRGAAGPARRARESPPRAARPAPPAACPPATSWRRSARSPTATCASPWDATPRRTTSTGCWTRCPTAVAGLRDEAGVAGL